MSYEIGLLVWIDHQQCFSSYYNTTRREKRRRRRSDKSKLKRSQVKVGFWRGWKKMNKCRSKVTSNISRCYQIFLSVIKEIILSFGSMLQANSESSHWNSEMCTVSRFGMGNNNGEYNSSERMKTWPKVLLYEFVRFHSLKEEIKIHKTIKAVYDVYYRCRKNTNSGRTSFGRGLVWHILQALTLAWPKMDFAHTGLGQQLRNSSKVTKRFAWNKQDICGMSKSCTYSTCVTTSRFRQSETFLLICVSFLIL